MKTNALSTLITKSKPRRLTPLLLPALAILGLGASAGCARSDARVSAEVAPPEVPVQPVAARAVPPRFEATGHTAASHQVDVRARVGGYVVTAPFTEGAQVAAGTLLYEIDSRPFLAMLEHAEAEVARARAAADLAKQEFARAERLAKSEAISREEIDRRRTALETALAAVSAAVAQRNAAALDVEFTRVKAPIDGRVGRALVKPGNLVTGGDAGGSLLTSVVSVQPLHVLIALDEPAYRQLTAFRAQGVNLRAEVRLSSGDQVLEGLVDYLAPALDARSGTAQARVVLPNPDERLPAGLFARVSIVADTTEHRVVVPETAIGAAQGRRHVLVVDANNLVHQRPVLLGERRGDERVIDAGVDVGEAIIVAGLQRVQPGMTV